MNKNKKLSEEEVFDLCKGHLKFLKGNTEFVELLSELLLDIPSSITNILLQGGNEILLDLNSNLPIIDRMLELYNSLSLEKKILLKRKVNYILEIYGQSNKSLNFVNKENS